VLALVMAAALVIVIIVLAAFLKVESRLAINSVLMTRARLNTIASLRLAQGSMQLMLGPDTRVTAPASAFDDPLVPADTAFDYPILGVWRSWEGLDHETSNAAYLGRPFKPDYNSKATDNFDKTTGTIVARGRFLGWLTSNSYTPIVVAALPPPPAPSPPPAARFTVVKPGPGTFNGTFSAKPSLPKPLKIPPTDPNTPRPPRQKPQKPTVAAAPNELPLWTNYGRFAAFLSPSLAFSSYSSPIVGTETAKKIGTTTSVSTDMVTLAPIDFPDSLSGQVSDSNFAWWVSGENQKALVSLEAPPATISGATATDVIEVARRARTFGTIDLAALGLALGPTSSLPADSGLPSRASFDAAVKAGMLSVSTANKAGFHDYTTYSPGLLVNVANGGFRRDLSLLAETWDWMNQVDRTVRLPLFRTRPKIIQAANSADLLFGRPRLDSQVGALGNKVDPAETQGPASKGHTLMYYWSDYSNIGGTGISYKDTGTYRGLSFIPPIRSWNTMVDYMLQYRKAVVGGTPDTIVEMRPSDDRGSTGSSNPFYNYHEAVYRHPVVARLQFVFSATVTGAGPFQRHIIMQPYVTFWNPYNVRIKVPDVTVNILAAQLPVGFSKYSTVSGDWDSIIVPIGYWFAQNRWDALQLKMVSGPTGIMDLGPGETRLYSVTDNGSVQGARSPVAPSTPATPSGYTWIYPQNSGAVASLTLRPGYVAGYNGGSGVWLTHWEDAAPKNADYRNGFTSMGILMRKINTGRDAIGIDMLPGASLNWARATPVRFSFGSDIWTDTAMWLFQSLYGPDDTNVANNYRYEDYVGKSRAFGTFAFGMRMANDGSTLNSYTITDPLKVANSQTYTTADYGIVSRGMLQSSPFAGYTELGDKSCEVLVYNANMYGTPAGSYFDPKKQNGIRYYGCMHPINAPFDLWWRPLSDAKDSYAPQSDPTTKVGYVVSGLEPATGLSKAVVAEMPLMPLQSLADLQNWDARGFNPAPPFIFGLIGNSDASPVLPSDDIVGRWFLNNAGPTSAPQSRNSYPPQFLQHDDRYCLNHVLFDDWFVSSLAPDYSKWTQLNDDSKGANVVTELKVAWAKAIDGTGPLANRAYKPTSNAADLAMDSQGSVTWTGPNTASNPNLSLVGGTKIPDAWLKLGSYLTVNGQFNVNSTSVPAWTAVLRSLRDQKIPVLKTATAALETVGAGKTSLVRLLPSPQGLSVKSAGGPPDAALTGYMALTDAQLETLATEIVKQVRIRGPFLSLSEFVNRQLMAFDGTAIDPCLRGALQSALEVLQQSVSSINGGGGLSLNQTDSTKKAYDPLLYAAIYGKPTTPLIGYDPDDKTWGPNPKLDPSGFSADYINPQASVGNSSEGLPGWPRQADLLRRLAPIMSVRDETFTVRSLGEVKTAEGTARAWCEAVYQRVPEYVDPRIEPWKAPMSDYIPAGGVYPENGAKPYMYMANAVFGRRLKLVSFRWLRADEL